MKDKENEGRQKPKEHKLPALLPQSCLQQSLLPRFLFVVLNTNVKKESMTVSLK